MRKLIFLKEFLALTPESKSKICNGAGSSRYFDFVPDTMWFLNLNCAADEHDYMYYAGKSRLDKIIADCVYAFNMFAHIENESNFFTSFLRKNRAMKYAMAVNSFGDSSFFVEDKNNVRFRDEESFLDRYNHLESSFEIIKRFLLVSKNKKIIFKSIDKSFESSVLYETPGVIVRAIIDDYEKRNEKKVISDYESSFQSVF